MGGKNFLQESNDKIVDRVRQLLIYTHPLTFTKEDVKGCLLEEFPETILLGDEMIAKVVEAIWDDITDG